MRKRHLVHLFNVLAGKIESEVDGMPEWKATLIEGKAEEIFGITRQHDRRKCE
jgi:hypothetical protein